MKVLKRIICLFKGHILSSPSITMAIGENNWCRKCDRCGYYVLHGDIGGVTITEKEALDFKKRFETEMIILKALQNYEAEEEKMAEKECIERDNAFDFSKPIRYKLSANDAEKIRKMYADGVTQAEIAKQFGVSQVHVHNIVAGKRWTGNDKRVKVHQR